MKYLLLLCIALLQGCASTEVVHTEYQYMIPDKIARPDKPALIEFNADESMCSVNNFKILQLNMLMLTTYIQSLNQVIDYYENYIDTTNRRLHMEKK